MEKKKIARKVSMYKGLPIIDSDKDLEITVSKTDVQHAKRKDASRCAAAIATSRALGTEVEVHISRTYVKDKKKKRWIRFITPESVRREITSFDRSDIFEPGDYVLKAAYPSAKLGNYSHKGGKKTRKNNKRHRTTNIREQA